MNITPEQLERFFNKQCTSEEAAQAAAFLKANPAVLEKYLSEIEWNRSETDYFMDDAFWDEVWEDIKRKKQQVIVTRMKQGAVAACIVCVLGLGYLIFMNKRDQNNLASNKVSIKNEHAIAATVQHKIIKNTSGKAMQILLPDDSRITLSSGATIAYEVPF